MVTYDPVSDEEARMNESNCFEPGTYPFVVVDLEAKTSKKGNPMMRAVLEVRVGDANRKVYEYLMLSGSMAWRFKRFCQAIGMGDEYETGSIDENECIGLTGRAEFEIEEGDGEYGDKNRVAEFIERLEPRRSKKSEAARAAAASAPASDVDEDDIPF